MQNAFVHIDLLHSAAIRILVFTDRIEIINPGCLYGGLQVDDIKLGVSRQRNPLMAALAAKTMIYRGLGSGINPKETILLPKRMMKALSKKKILLSQRTEALSKRICPLPKKRFWIISGIIQKPIEMKL